VQYCPAKKQNEWNCPAYTNTRVGKYGLQQDNPISNSLLRIKVTKTNLKLERVFGELVTALA